MMVHVRFTGDYAFSFFFGVLTVLFWATTYCLIIFAGYKSRTIRKVSMPYTAGVLNFAWEICALLFWKYDGIWAFVIWFVIDLFIVYFGFRYLSSLKEKFFYFASILFTIFILFLIFQTTNGFIYSVYAIDLIMAAAFLLGRKNLSPFFKVPIAIAKLLGDLFAGFVFYYDYPFVVVTSSLVLICNAFYLHQCAKERNNKSMC